VAARGAERLVEVRAPVVEVRGDAHARAPEEVDLHDGVLLGALGGSPRGAALTLDADEASAVEDEARPGGDVGGSGAGERRLGERREDTARTFGVRERLRRVVLDRVLHAVVERVAPANVHLGLPGQGALDAQLAGAAVPERLSLRDQLTAGLHPDEALVLPSRLVFEELTIGSVRRDHRQARVRQHGHTDGRGQLRHTALAQAIPTGIGALDERLGVLRLRRARSRRRELGPRNVRGRACGLG
jgi:hypothetical protein